MSDEEVPALFAREGECLVPTQYAVGPWRPDSLHGAAVAALFGAILDRQDRTVARITVDLTTAVPCKPLRLELIDHRGGRRVQRQSAELLHEDRVVARATALYVARSELDTPTPLEQFAAPPTELSPLPETRAGWIGFESRALALHTRREGDAMCGWFRLLMPAIADETVSGLQAVMAAADYTSGATAILLSLRKWAFMSLDLTVNLVRRPEPDWIGVRADRAVLGADGTGAAASSLHDAQGALGVCTMTQFVQSIQRVE